MSLSESFTLSNRLTALAQRLGLIGRGPRQILSCASTLRLPFQMLTPMQDSIGWQDTLQLQRLLNLPRNALSGPVQEDKASAHSVLTQLVEAQIQPLQSIDLRSIDGFSCALDTTDYSCFEAYAASTHCKSIRIISYRDFVRTLSQALPNFQAGETIELRQASWRGSRIFWTGEQHGEAFASAIAYARLRGLEVLLPARLIRYNLSLVGLDNLQMHYHALAMPGEAWSNPTFMALLLDSGLPYARLSLPKSSDAPEFLLLPKAHQEATALGEGLRLAGAPDVIDYLRRLVTDD
ncbi:DUF6685 family protein [Pseudomonas sp. NCCP-436]|uniref:DUF6685 family protein n=1 Tax=Pseudomonas sp. NCCP-436 TaxID=2842481 RepID=UPI001C7F6311|nr:DUF6685 family protein [Pseudomonas sp. NCCP-436]GIZ13911.1 hypothetical protein NCCP436_33270 [Pseudomonas sp. NCCP-436]